MIYVDRDAVPMPKLFESERLKMEEELQIVPRLGATSKFKQARFNRNIKLLHRVRPELKKLFHNKCCYCESIILTNFDIEHFRPISSIGRKDNLLEQGYYWLSYKWLNVYVACAQCNRYKANYFPVEEKRLKPPSINVYKDNAALQHYVRSENAHLIDPCNPDDHRNLNFKYEKNGKITPLSKRAEITIEVLKLNRENLTTARKRHFEYIENVKRDVYFNNQLMSVNQEGILSVLDLGEPYLGLTRQIVLNWALDKRNELSTLIPDFWDSLKKKLNLSLDKEKLNLKRVEKVTHTKSTIKTALDHSLTGVKEQYLQYFKFIDWIDIKNFKCISQTRLDLNKNKENFGENGILLIGENGVGKSTILQAIALAMVGEKQLKEMPLGDLSKLIRRQTKSKTAVITIQFLDEDDPVVVEITPEGISCNKKELVKPVVAIGSIRRLPETGETVTYDDDPSRILGLFKHNVVYPEIEHWLTDTKSVTSDQFNEAAKTIIDLLMVPEEFIGANRLLNRRSGKLTINVGNGAESIEEMCDGHKSVIGYALYIMRVLSEYGGGSSFDTEGIVIIDEIGNHLHPTWKIKIVSLLRKVFPRTIFVISTHDPLCLRNARKGEVWVMNKAGEGQELRVEQKDIPVGTPLENLLTGKWFYMEHTTDERTSQLIAEHSELIFSESPDEGRIKAIEEELEGNMVRAASSGHSTYDTFIDVIHDIKSETISKLENDEDLRQKLADKIREQISL